MTRSTTRIVLVGLGVIAVMAIALWVALAGRVPLPSGLWWNH